jgi:hypothetical protein
MKSFLVRPAVRGGSYALLSALLLFSLSASADVLKGAALQRQLAQTKPHKMSATPRAESGKSSACRPANPAGGETIVVTTGSHIPKETRKRQQITDGAQNLQALDRKQLERTGATSVTDAVRRLVP